MKSGTKKSGIGKGSEMFYQSFMIRQARLAPLLPKLFCVLARRDCTLFGNSVLSYADSLRFLRLVCQESIIAML